MSSEDADKRPEVSRTLLDIQALGTTQDYKSGFLYLDPQREPRTERSASGPRVYTSSGDESSLAGDPTHGGFVIDWACEIRRVSTILNSERDLDQCNENSQPRSEKPLLD